MAAESPRASIGFRPYIALKKGLYTDFQGQDSFIAAFWYFRVNMAKRLDFDAFSLPWSGLIQRSQQRKRERSVLSKKKKQRKRVQQEDFQGGHPSW